MRVRGLRLGFGFGGRVREARGPIAFADKACAEKTRQDKTRQDKTR